MKLFKKMDISPLEQKEVKNTKYATGLKFFHRRGVKITLIVVGVIILAAGFVFWRANGVMQAVSGGKGIFSSLVHAIPGVKDELDGEKEGRINIALLGMRGEKVEGGGLLADTIMVLSIKSQENKASLISIPRDLYVTVPNTQDKQKINAVHFYGEEKGRGRGLKYMENILSEVAGVPISYAVSINFEGFKQLVEAVGGVEINLEAPFEERLQFLGLEARCDGITYTIPSGKFEEKRIKRKNGTYYANPKRYPLCFQKMDPEKLECGGDFKLPAGKNILNGDQALCFARSRVTSNDFERAKRQQVVVQALKDKMTSVGTLTDFEKINGILKSLSDNVRTDMELWEMKRFYEIYKQVPNPQMKQKVLDTTEEGLLYNPPENGAGYILLPRGDNYDQIHKLFQDILN